MTLSVSRDSDALERSNWSVITTTILAAYPDDTAIERSHHWAVGWIDRLLVRPGSPAVAAMEQWHQKLDNYPVADEDAYGLLEYNEEWCVRCDRGTREYHPLNGCKFRSADDADEIAYRWRNRREMSLRS